MFTKNGNKEKMKELEDKIAKIEAFLPAVELWLTVLSNWFKQNKAYIDTFSQQVKVEDKVPVEPKKEEEKSVQGA